VERGAVTRTLVTNAAVYAAAFSPDGKLFAAGGHDREGNNYFGRLWEVGTGKELYRFANDHASLRALAFSPDGKTLAGGGDDARLRLWDVATGKLRREFKPDGYRVRSVAFAPDGRTVAAAGDAVRLYDPATGQERLRIDRKALGLHFSADGKAVTGAVAGTIYRWDAATGRPLTPEAAGESPVDQIRVTADGRHVVTRGQDGDAHLWDARTGAHLRHIQATWQRGLALSPDGRYLVWPAADEKVKFRPPGRPNEIHTGHRLRLYDLAAGRFLDRFPAFQGDAHDLAFTADGKTLVTVDHGDGTVRMWDVAAGKELRSFRAVRREEELRSHYVWHAVLSPEGRTLAVTYQPSDRGIFAPFAVRLWDVASGKETHELPGHHRYVDGMAFSPDSRLLVTGCEPLAKFAQEMLKKPVNQLFVWDVASGRRPATLPDGLPVGAVAAAFAPDGRTFATADPDGTIRLWEVATWGQRAEFRGHRGRVNALAFAPDGRLLSGGLDTTVLVWDVRPPRAGAAGELADAWDELAQAKAAPAFKAQGRLLADSAGAVELFAAKIKPVEPVEAKRLARLIADLAGPQFATRDAATRSLRELGGRAVAALREAAEKAESLETRRRAGRLLAELTERPVPAEALRVLRAVEALEWANTPAARRLLAGWARGASGARLTEASADALRRLKSADQNRE
jgi:WD40 repeat protein